MPIDFTKYRYRDLGTFPTELGERQLLLFSTPERSHAFVLAETAPAAGDQSLNLTSMTIVDDRLMCLSHAKQVATHHVAQGLAARPAGRTCPTCGSCSQPGRH